MWAPKIIVAETPAEKKIKLCGTIAWALLLLSFFGGVINKFSSTLDKRDAPLMKSGYEAKVSLPLPPLSLPKLQEKESRFKGRLTYPRYSAFKCLQHANFPVVAVCPSPFITLQILKGTCKAGNLGDEDSKMQDCGM
jgi:hypothetical protein